MNSNVINITVLQKAGTLIYYNQNLLEYFKMSHGGGIVSTKIHLGSSNGHVTDTIAYLWPVWRNTDHETTFGSHDCFFGR